MAVRWWQSDWAQPAAAAASVAAGGFPVVPVGNGTSMRIEQVPFQVRIRYVDGVTNAQGPGIDDPAVPRWQTRWRSFGDFERFASISEMTAEKLDAIHARIARLADLLDTTLDYGSVADLEHVADDVVFAEIENCQAVFGSKQVTVPVWLGAERSALARISRAVGLLHSYESGRGTSRFGEGLRPVTYISTHG